MTEETSPPPKETPTKQDPLGFSIDWDHYAEYLDDSDLTEHEKREFIATLWQIALGFVDLGFRMHPLQQCETQNETETCAQPSDIRQVIGASMLDLEELPDINTMPSYDLKEALQQKESAHE
jgi:hypothetical protein